MFLHVFVHKLPFYFNVRRIQARFLLPQSKLNLTELIPTPLLLHESAMNLF